MPKRLAVLTLLTALCACAAYAARFVDHGGRWPESWPEEMEPLRERSMTYTFSSAIEHRDFVIPFDDRDEFERVWPAIRGLASPGAPIRLVSGPREFWEMETPVVAGVQIFEGRSTVSITTKQDGQRKQFELKAPWPERFYQSDGTLYTHAVFDFENFRWEPRTRDTALFVGFRIRTDIVLIVDEDVIDLDRIELPEDAPVMDQRKSTEAEVDDSETSEDSPTQ